MSHRNDGDSPATDQVFPLSSPVSQSLCFASKGNLVSGLGVMPMSLCLRWFREVFF